MFEYTEYNIDDKITKLELLKPNEQSLGEILNANWFKSVYSVLPAIELMRFRLLLLK